MQKPIDRKVAPKVCIMNPAMNLPMSAKSNSTIILVTRRLTPAFPHSIEHL